ncbi:MAG: ribonuclease Y [bacterium]|nr:ribonuclease Y [bacterium]
MNILYVLLSLLVGGGFGFTIAKSGRRNLDVKAEQKAKEIIREAELKERELLDHAKEQGEQAKTQAKAEYEDKQKYLLSLEKQLREREQTLDQRGIEQDGSRKDIEKKYDEIISLKDSLKELRVKQEESLQKIAAMNRDEAKELLLSVVEREGKDDILRKMKAVDAVTQEEWEGEARTIIATVIGRIASDVIAESTIYSVEIPNEEMKGRLIGKDGRNIQAFEKATGVDLLIDDTPGAVIISSFSPLRREIARVALTQMVKDGRVNPGRIEEVLAKAQEEVGRVVMKAGEEAALDAQVRGLPKEIIKVLGQLKFRTSYGQNVLSHSVEVSRIAGMLAAELKADQNVCRQAGLLHDLGKALDRDIQAPHHHISGDIAKKYGLSEAVIHAILAHHDDTEPTTIEAWIVRASDAISSARPGARRGTYEEYVERLQELENIANTFDGVDKAYAIQAGREVRILVNPREIDDLAMAKLAKKVARKIEEEMQYPGQVTVNVIRETKAQAIAE